MDSFSYLMLNEDDLYTAMVTYASYICYTPCFYAFLWSFACDMYEGYDQLLFVCQLEHENSEQSYLLKSFQNSYQDGEIDDKSE